MHSSELKPGASATVRLRFALPLSLSRGSYTATAEVSAADVPGAGLYNNGVTTGLTPFMVL